MTTTLPAIDQLEAMLAAATKGPWDVEAGWRDGFDHDSGHYTYEDGTGMLLGPEGESLNNDIPNPPVFFQRIEDAQFCAAMKHAGPALLACARTLKKLSAAVATDFISRETIEDAEKALQMLESGR